MEMKGQDLRVEDAPRKTPVVPLAEPFPTPAATGVPSFSTGYDREQNFFRLWYTVKPLVIGGRKDHDAPYLKRWFVIPRNKWFNIYVHKFEGSDDDEALHDHPWWWCSVVLRQGYWEERPGYPAKWRSPGSVAVRGPKSLHRVELEREDPFQSEIPAWTLFITGPKLRTWGFQCPQGWIPWQKFTDPESGGCGEL